MEKIVIIILVFFILEITIVVLLACISARIKRNKLFDAQNEADNKELVEMAKLEAD